MPYFALYFGVNSEQLLEPFYVTTHIGVPIIASRIYRNYMVVVKGRETIVDLMN